MPKKELDLDLITSYTLKTGVIVSLFFIVFGTILIFVRNGGMNHDLAYVSDFSNMNFNSKFIPLGGIPAGLAALDGVYYVTTGLWVLIFTPISVVFIAIIDFLKDKNRLYVVMSILVLFNLFFAMLVIPRIT